MCPWRVHYYLINVAYKNWWSISPQSLGSPISDILLAKKILWSFTQHDFPSFAFLFGLCTHLVLTVLTSALLLCCGWQYLALFNRGQTTSSIWSGHFPAFTKTSPLPARSCYEQSHISVFVWVTWEEFLLWAHDSLFMPFSFLPCKHVFWLPWWHSVHPESVWPSESSGWLRLGVSGPARPGAPAPVPAATGRLRSASCRTLQSSCTRALTLRRDGTKDSHLKWKLTELHVI